ncbi:hypothetical protein CRUP_032562 [Coryphaenoides rupestris]|nr:hypothetical protein CRUP_032562 [Coryphaenoides rupestris]
MLFPTLFYVYADFCTVKNYMDAMAGAIPKKGARAKGSRLTEEDRVLLLQQRAEAEKEIAKFFKAKLQEEEKNTAANLPKLTQKWRTVLRQTVCAKLRREIEIVRQSFERVLDHKNSVVKRLVSDLNEAEQQFGQQLHAHLHCVDSLLALQASRLPFQQQRNDFQELGAEFNTEREHISSLHQHDCTHLEIVTFAKEQRRSKVDAETQQNYTINIAETKQKHIGEMDTLRIDMKCVVQKVRKGHKGHLPPGDDQRIASNALLSNAQRRAHKLGKQIKELRKIQFKSSQELTQRDHQHKTQFDQASALDRKRLTTLTVESSNAAKQLQGIVSKALLDYADLAGFWCCYNKVLLERLCLKKEKDILTRDNQQLQALLRQ